MGATTGMSTGTCRGCPQDVTRPLETTETSVPPAGAHRHEDPTLGGPYALNTSDRRCASLTWRRHRRCARDEDSDLLTCRGHWFGTNMQVLRLTVNRARLGDAEDSSFPSALPCSAGCEFTWLGTPSPPIPLSTPGHVERHGRVHDRYFRSLFACS